LTDSPSDKPAEGTWRILVALAAVVLVLVVLRFGWVSDDAFISFRAIANLARGYGLVSNPPERVQGFTNPLWTLALVLPYLLLRNIYWVSVLAGLASTAGLAVLLARRLPARSALLALVLLTASQSVVVFSTSGLENSLAHLLLVAFFLERFQERSKRLWVPWLLAGLVALNRLDHLLLIAPALALQLRSDGLRSSWRRALFGFAPVLVWIGFALVYYGFAWPNTAYAKLNTAIPRLELWLQGVSYLVDASLRDGMLFVVLGAAVVVVVRARSRSPGGMAALGGIALYMLYVAWIGGDFMGGRFLTAPYVIATLYLAHSLAELGAGAFAAVAAVALFWGRYAMQQLPVDPKTECVLVPSGIVDERACYVEHTGIAQNLRTKKYEKHPYYDVGVQLRKNGVRVTHNTLVGLAGYAAGPRVHIVDDYGLTDPLLARIRFEPGAEWRIGHFRRGIPAGYLESLESGENRLTDPCLKSLYDDLSVVTRGRLFASGRSSAIWRLNFVHTSCRAH